MNILLVDDEKEIIDLIELYMQNQKVEIYKAHNGQEALDLMNQTTIDLLVADIMMPGLDGYDLVKAVRKTSQIPIILISAKDRGQDKIYGLNLGADDYICKPFDPMEVVARINAHIRRSYTYQPSSSPRFEINGLVVDGQSCQVTYRDSDLDLTATEYKILKYLLDHQNAVKTKEQIFYGIWGIDYHKDDNSIRVHISNLREKLDRVMPVQIIQTIRGLGYRLREVKDEI